jgi:hypothetical protein
MLKSQTILKSLLVLLLLSGYPAAFVAFDAAYFLGYTDGYRSAQAQAWGVQQIDETQALMDVTKEFLPD